jgi:hypothetical protein
MRGKREYRVDYQERWAKIKEEKVLIDGSS